MGIFRKKSSKKLIKNPTTDGNSAQTNHVAAYNIVGVPLLTVMQHENSEIPAFIESLVEYIRLPENLQANGLFRIVSSQDELDMVVEAVSETYPVDLASMRPVPSVHAACSALQFFLENLEDKLLTQDAVNVIRQYGNDLNRVISALLDSTLEELRVLMYILDLMREAYAYHEHNRCDMECVCQWFRFALVADGGQDVLAYLLQQYSHIRDGVIQAIDGTQGGGDAAENASHPSQQHVESESLVGRHRPPSINVSLMQNQGAASAAQSQPAQQYQQQSQQTWSNQPQYAQQQSAPQQAPATSYADPAQSMPPQQPPHVQQPPTHANSRASIDVKPLPTIPSKRSSLQSAGGPMHQSELAEVPLPTRSAPPPSQGVRAHDSSLFNETRLSSALNNTRISENQKDAQEKWNSSYARTVFEHQDKQLSGLQGHIHDQNRTIIDLQGTIEALQREVQGLRGLRSPSAGASGSSSDPPGIDQLRIEVNTLRRLLDDEARERKQLELSAKFNEKSAVSEYEWKAQQHGQAVDNIVKQMQSMVARMDHVANVVDRCADRVSECERRVTEVEQNVNTMSFEVKKVHAQCNRVSSELDLRDQMMALEARLKENERNWSALMRPSRTPNGALLQGTLSSPETPTAQFHQNRESPNQREYTGHPSQDHSRYASQTPYTRYTEPLLQRSGLNVSAAPVTPSTYFRTPAK